MTGPEALSIADVTETISVSTGRRVRYEVAPPDDARDWLLAAGLPVSFADFLVDFYAAVRKGAHDVITGHIAEVTSRPPRFFGDFAQEHADAFLDGR